MPRVPQQQEAEMAIREVMGVYEQAIDLVNTYRARAKGSTNRDGLARIANAISIEKSVLVDTFSAAMAEGNYAWRPALITVQELLQKFDAHKYREIPPVLSLRKDRDMLVEKRVYWTDTWGRDHERRLLGLMKQAREYDRNANEGETFQGQSEMEELRARRRRHYKTATYKLVRGPYEASETKTNSSEPEYEVLKRLLFTMRRKISHERGALRAIPTGRNERLRGVRMKPGHFIRKLSAKRNYTVTEAKKPLNSAKHVGIELEFCSPASPEELSCILGMAGLGKFVTLKGDGSLRTSAAGHYTHEICILATETEYKKVVLDVCKTLVEAGSYVNKTCGVHVHLDMRGRKPEEAFNRLVRSLNILYAMVPPTRRESKYCIRNTADEAFQPNGDQRYKAVNPSAYSRHKTIEIRLHSGTLSPRKVNHWVAILIAIADTPNKVTFKRLESFLDTVQVSPETAAYMKERIDQFNTEGIDDDKEIVSRVYEGRTYDNQRGPRCECDTCRMAPGRDAVGRNSVQPDYTPEFVA